MYYHIETAGSYSNSIFNFLRNLLFYSSHSISYFYQWHTKVTISSRSFQHICDFSFYKKMLAIENRVNSTIRSGVSYFIFVVLEIIK